MESKIQRQEAGIIVTDQDNAVPTLTTITREFKQQGMDLADICVHPQLLVDALNERSSEIYLVGYPLHSENDLSIFTEEEHQASENERRQWAIQAPEWEIRALKHKLYELYGWVTKVSPQRLDVGLYQESMEGLTEAVYELGTAQEETLQLLRGDIKYHMSNALFGLFLKHFPRFYREQGTNTVVVDDNSKTWSPDYYRMAERNVHKRLAGMVGGKSILDPFAGAGAFMNSLMIHGIPQEAYFSDLCYLGGRNVNGHDVVYDPILNRQMTLQAFDGLPSWYKPPYERIKGYATADASQIPFADHSVDLVVCDPPYGKTLKEGGVSFLMGFLPEMFRVSREGAVLMVPTPWLAELNERNVQYTDFTGDPSYGESGYPICYIYLPKQNI